MPTTPITSKQLANFQKQLEALQSDLQAHNEHLSQIRAENLPGPTFLLKELEAKLLAAESQLGELSAKSAALQKQLEAKLLAAESHLGELFEEHRAPKTIGCPLPITPSDWRRKAFGAVSE